MFQGSDKKSKRKTVCLTLHGPELLDEAVKNQVFIFIQGAGDWNTFFYVTIKKHNSWFFSKLYEMLPTRSSGRLLHLTN